MERQPDTKLISDLEKNIKPDPNFIKFWERTKFRGFIQTLINIGD